MWRMLSVVLMLKVISPKWCPQLLLGLHFVQRLSRSCGVIVGGYL
jgi:hypothetical protein